MKRTNQLPNLEKLFKDDDEQDFAPVNGSNLATLFSTPYTPVELSSSPKSLTPKKINNEKNSISSSTNKTEVILAKAVHAYKLNNGQYILIGKLGIALTGNVSTKTYLLILYRNKQEHVSVVTLTEDFLYSVRENNYATYYDGNNDNWSILFDSDEACIEFAREIAISKYLLRQGNADETAFYQDLTASNAEGGAKENDRVHVKYSITTNIVQPLKINTAIQDTTVEITTDNNWEKTLVNAGKGLKRILVLPPSKQISLGPGFPQDRDIVLEVEVIDIIPPEKMQIPSPKPNTKASLISRMAKMGQSILPKIPTSTTTDSEDTEEEVQIKSSRRLKNLQPENQPKNHHRDSVASSVQEAPEPSIQTANIIVQRNIIPATMASPLGTIIPTSTFNPAWAPAPIQQYMSTADGQLYPIQQPMSQSIGQSVDPNISVFLSETRTHNAEIRMGMSKIADNVQKLLDKFHVLEVQNAASPSHEKALETSLKMLLALNVGKTDKMENTRTNNESLDTEKNLFTAESSEKEKLKSLENELDTMKNCLMQNANKLDTIRNEKDIVESQKLEMQAKIDKLEASLIDARDKAQQSLLEIKSVNDLYIKSQKDNAKLEAKIITLDAERKVLERALLAKEKILTTEHDKTVEIKQIMNKTYQTLVGKFTENAYSAEYIKATVATTIKAITLQVLSEGKHDANSNASSDTEIKESNADSKSSVQDTDLNISQEDNITLPDVIAGPDGIDVTSVIHEEPPPVPPMDLDIDRDWTP